MRIRMAAIAGLMAGMALSSTALGAVWETWRDDTTEVRVTTAGPEDAAQTILLVHDWFGYTPFSQEVVDHWVALGYRVGAVDLYDGMHAETHAEAWALMQALNAETVAAQLSLAIERLDRESGSLALMAFSMGVPFAIEAAGHSGERVDALAVWYGDTSLEAGEADGLTLPILAIYGSLDGAAADQAATLSQEMDGVDGTAEVYVYPGAHHAFAQPLFNAGETYDPAATSAAWALTEDFFSRRMN